MKSSGDGCQFNSIEKPMTTTECLDKFSKMIQNASLIASRLSSNELLAAFQISLNLIEKISDVMINACISTKSNNNDFLDSLERWKYQSCSSNIQRKFSPNVAYFREVQGMENDIIQDTNYESTYIESQRKLALEAEINDEDNDNHSATVVANAVEHDEDDETQSESIGETKSDANIVPHKDIDDDNGVNADDKNDNDHHAEDEDGDNIEAQKSKIGLLAKESSSNPDQYTTPFRRVSRFNLKEDNELSFCSPNNLSSSSSPRTNCSSVLETDDCCLSSDNNNNNNSNNGTTHINTSDSFPSIASDLADDDSKQLSDEKNPKQHYLRKCNPSSYSKQGSDSTYSQLNGTNYEQLNEDELQTNNNNNNNVTNPHGSKFQNELKRWRLTSTDKLNTLIDECERQLNGRKLYVCKFCGKLYEIKSSMRYHMKIIHLQMHLRTTEMQCRICGKQFTCVSAVNRHQSKCILSSLTETRLQKTSQQFNNNNNNNSFNGHSIQAMDTTDMNVSQLAINSFVLQNCSNMDTSDKSTLIDDANQNVSNVIMDNNNNKNNMTSEQAAMSTTPNFHSAFRIPENYLQRSGSTFYGLQSNTNNLINPEVIQTMSITPNSNHSGTVTPINLPATTTLTLPNTNCDLPAYISQIGGVSDTLDHRWTANWPANHLSGLGCGLSDLTPAQLDACMKAVVQNIRSNVEKSEPILDSTQLYAINDAIKSHTPSSVAVSSIPAGAAMTTTSSSSLTFSSCSIASCSPCSFASSSPNAPMNTFANTVSDNRWVSISSAQPRLEKPDSNFNSHNNNNNDIAMDLSSRPRSTSVMIKSF